MSEAVRPGPGTRLNEMDTIADVFDLPAHHIPQVLEALFERLGVVLVQRKPIEGHSYTYEFLEIWQAVNKAKVFQRDLAGIGRP